METLRLYDLVHRVGDVSGSRFVRIKPSVLIKFSFCNKQVERTSCKSSWG